MCLLYPPVLEPYESTTDGLEGTTEAAVTPAATRLLKSISSGAGGTTSPKETPTRALGLTDLSQQQWFDMAYATSLGVLWALVHLWFIFRVWQTYGRRTMNERHIHLLSGSTVKASGLAVLNAPQRFKRLIRANTSPASTFMTLQVGPNNSTSLAASRDIPRAKSTTHCRSASTAATPQLNHGTDTPLKQTGEGLSSSVELFDIEQGDKAA